LAKIQMIENRLESYFEAVYPKTAAQKKKGEKPARWDFLREIFEGQPDLQSPGVSSCSYLAQKPAHAIARLRFRLTPGRAHQGGSPEETLAQDQTV
jgi:hypothetical protein